MELEQETWIDIYLCDDANTAAELLTKKINKVLDKHAPLKTFQVRKNYVPWLTVDLKNMMKKRDQALELAIRSKKQEDRLLFKNLRNSVTNQIKKEKKNWQQRKLEMASNNPPALWNNVKTWLSWGDNGPPSKIQDNGKLITKPVEVAEHMNHFFMNKVERLNSKIPTSNDDPCKKLKEMMKETVPSQ